MDMRREPDFNKRRENPGKTVNQEPKIFDYGRGKGKVFIPHLAVAWLNKVCPFLVWDQIGIKNFIIGTRINSDGNDQETYKRTTDKTYGVDIHPKKTTKESPKLLVEVKAKVYYGLRTMTKKSKNMDKWKAS